MRRMPISIAILTGVLTVLMLIPLVAAEWSTIWRDDFDYQTVEELKSAGWTVTPDHGGPFFENQGSVALYEVASISYHNFSQQIPEFSVETGVLHAGLIVVTTQRHNYRASSVYSGDKGPIPGRYVFEADGQSKFQIDVANWNGQLLHTLTLEKKGNTLSVYADGSSKGDYSESDNAPDALSEVSLRGGGSVYDYVSVKTLTPSPPRPTLPFWILIILMIALAVFAAIVFFILAFFARQRKRLRARYSQSTF